MVKTRMIPEQRLQQAAECLKVLAHPGRLRMVELILDQPRAVGELATACGLTVAVTSGHLRLLERCGLLVGTREGRHRYYAAGKPCLAGFIRCIREEI
jgi:DNA-binding transcriptional ArsR family regulator